MRIWFIKSLVSLATVSLTLVFAFNNFSYADGSETSWPDWRGTNRDGQSGALPRILPDKPEIVWRVNLTGPAMAGIAATDDYVLVADKSADAKHDLLHCFVARTGKQKWSIKRDAPGRMEYTNSPRATPVIVGNHVYFQAAFGLLICADLDSGQVVWEKHLRHDLGGEVPTWGYSVPPLVVDEQLIVAPGGIENALVALDRSTGKMNWSIKGHAAAYAPFIVESFGGKRQIIGYDAASLGGWDIDSGKRLWQLVPPDNSDFNVPTPVRVGDQILLATENNGTRLYDFNNDGTIIKKPTSELIDCGPDTCTPVVAQIGNRTRVFCSAYGELYCMDAKDKLRVVWSESDERFYDHTCLIYGNERVLLWSTGCDLLLIDATSDDMKIVSQVRPMSDEDAESMSHPAVVRDRIYLRSQTELICMRLK